MGRCSPTRSRCSVRDLERDAIRSDRTSRRAAPRLLRRLRLLAMTNRPRHCERSEAIQESRDGSRSRFILDSGDQFGHSGAEPQARSRASSTRSGEEPGIHTPQHRGYGFRARGLVRPRPGMTRNLSTECRFTSSRSRKRVGGDGIAPASFLLQGEGSRSCGVAALIRSPENQAWRKTIAIINAML
jgi:hypothetical protein